MMTPPSCGSCIPKSSPGPEGGVRASADPTRTLAKAKEPKNHDIGKVSSVPQRYLGEDGLSLGSSTILVTSLPPLTPPLLGDSSRRVTANRGASTGDAPLPDVLTMSRPWCGGPRVAGALGGDTGHVKALWKAWAVEIDARSSASGRILRTVEEWGPRASSEQCFENIQRNSPRRGPSVAPKELFQPLTGESRREAGRSKG
mmetsp:Transcript_15090/g.37774  ORF Transcript_15090/g.37774 Transcript_15090/m.37774 type:complete len:201 (-) Transcript_15090:206-808(-)